MFPEFFKLLPSLLLDCAKFATSAFGPLGLGLFRESWEVWNISKLCLFWNYHRYLILCFTAGILLVEVGTVFVFLGRSLLVKDQESQEDWYLFEICPFEVSEQICHQIPISCVHSFPSHFTACLF